MCINLLHQKLWLLKWIIYDHILARRYYGWAIMNQINISIWLCNIITLSWKFWLSILHSGPERFIICGRSWQGSVKLWHCSWKFWLSIRWVLLGLLCPWLLHTLLIYCWFPAEWCSHVGSCKACFTNMSRRWLIAILLYFNTWQLLSACFLAKFWWNFLLIGKQISNRRLFIFCLYL